MLPLIDMSGFSGRYSDFPFHIYFTGIVRDNVNVNNGANLKRRPSYTMMVGRMIRKLSTVQEQEEEEEDEEEGEEEVVEENGGDLRNSIHQRRLLELLVGQEVEMRHFEVKKLRQGNNRSSYTMCMHDHFEI